MRKEHLENVGKTFHLYSATNILKLGRALEFSQIEKSFESKLIIYCKFMVVKVHGVLRN